MSEAEQSFSRWFTDWPSTHERAGLSVEVMPVAEHLAAMKVTEEMVDRALKAQFGHVDLLDVGDPYFRSIRRDIVRHALKAALGDV